MNALPSANVRVPSLPGVSASIGAPVAAALVGADGWPHVSAWPPAATIGVAVLCGLVLPADAGTALLLALDCALGLLPPEPPQAVSIESARAAAQRR